MSNENGDSPALPAVVARSCHAAELMGVGHILATSGLFTDTRSASQAAVKVLAGRELGFGAVASMRGVYLIQGRITLSANLMAAAIRRSDRYKYVIQKIDDKGCTIEFFRRDDPHGAWEACGPPSSFVEADAKRANLSNKETWKQYPRNLYFARAMANGARWYCPDVFAGHTPYTPDELSDKAKITADGEYDVPDVVIEVSPAGGGSPAAGVSSRENVVTRVRRLIAETNTDEKRFLAHYKRKSVETMDDEQLAGAVALLEAKRAAVVS